MWFPGLAPRTHKSYQWKNWENQKEARNLVTSNVPTSVCWFLQMHDDNVRCKQWRKLGNGSKGKLYNLCNFSVNLKLLQISKFIKEKFL